VVEDGAVALELFGLGLAEELGSQMQDWAVVLIISILYQTLQHPTASMNVLTDR
jgi:hypothetical protein